MLDEIGIAFAPIDPDRPVVAAPFNLFFFHELAQQMCPTRLTPFCHRDAQDDDFASRIGDHAPQNSDAPPVDACRAMMIPTIQLPRLAAQSVLLFLRKSAWSTSPASRGAGANLPRSPSMINSRRHT
jgi:hypothetical protein